MIKGKKKAISANMLEQNHLETDGVYKVIDMLQIRVRILQNFIVLSVNMDGIVFTMKL